jgi:phenylalanine-4-hydroxylase
MSRYKSDKYQAKQARTDGFIDYTQSEHQMWADLYQAQISLVNRFMINEYVEGLVAIDLPSHRIPQCSEISEKLKNITGWQVKPVPALIGYDRFFEMLANKFFPAASFIRNMDDFTYVKEPDIFHEIFGHTPLLTHPTVAEFSQKIGQLGTQLEPHQHAWLARLYWFTIEFGLMYDHQGQVKPMGSGLASSPTEIVYAAKSHQPERRKFNILDVLTTPYRIDIKQPVYFVLQSFDQLLDISERNLIDDIKTAQKLGLKEPHQALSQKQVA